MFDDTTTKESKRQKLSDESKPKRKRYSRRMFKQVYRINELKEPIEVDMDDSVELQKVNCVCHVRNMSERDLEKIQQTMKLISSDLEFDNVFLFGQNLEIVDVIGRKMEKMSKSQSCRLKIVLDGIKQVAGKKTPIWSISKIQYNYL